MSSIQQIPNITINNILAYILPPSQLSQPLPNHLLSTSLIQRHHFLNITHENPIEYLCWPSPSREHVIQLLDNLATQKDDEEKVYHVRYTSDVEYTYAHVCLDGELRLVFQWDSMDMWKYHDANLMPFPPGSHESLQDALTDVAADVLSGSHSGSDELCRTSSMENSFRDKEVNENDDDAYWNAYSAQGDDDRSHQQNSHSKKAPTADSGEDAYWAQYATVHGSGDSTVPSPLPNDRRKMYHPFHLQPSTPPTPDDQNQQPLPIPIPRSKIHDRHAALEPPSPTALSERLKSITPRGGRSLSRPSSLGPGTPLESSYVPPSEDQIDGNVNNDTGDELHISLVSPEPLPVESNGILSAYSTDNANEEVALRESIRSVYRLWKMSRQSEGNEDDRELFIRVARQVIELP